MNIYKTPTPEEINEAAENYAHGRVFPPQKVEYSYSLLSIMKRQKEAAKDDFLAAISWLQNYQTQQSDTLMPKCKSCGNVLIGIYETDKGICEKCVNSKQQGAVRSLEQILKEHGVIEYDVRTNAAIQEYINQFQTTASGVSEWISVEDRVPNNGEEITAKCSHGQIANKAVYEDGRFVHRFNSVNKLELIDIEIKNVTHWQYTGQSSQPQPNAISFIEDYKKELGDIKFWEREKEIRIETLDYILTKLKKQP